MKRFFGWLPVGALKGEILEIKTDRPIQTLYNRGCFIIPMTDGLGAGRVLLTNAMT